jgi:hypothetical protein
LASAVADAAAGRQQALGELAEFGVTQVVVTASTPTTGGFADVDGLARVPATSTVVYRSTMPSGELVVLAARDAAGVTAGHALPSTAKPQPLDATSGHARVQLPAGGGPGRVLVLAEPHSGAWRARLDGHPLPAARAYGWAQAWRLPASGGVLTVQRDDGGRTGWLVLELVVVVVALVLSLPGRKNA